MTSIAKRLGEIHDAVAAAVARAPDASRDINVVAVTKNHPAQTVEALAASGVVDIGENRVQEALSKAVRVRAPVRWHMIGHLQRNKAARAAELFSCIHSVDRTSLVHALDRTGRELDVFLQINVSGEASKRGVRLEEAGGLWQTALNTDSLKVIGLMTMAPYAEDPEAARPVFRTLRQLRDDLNERGDGPPLTGLSMGMSGDFVVAVEEGATHLRIGTALVGAKPDAGQ